MKNNLFKISPRAFLKSFTSIIAFLLLHLCVAQAQKPVALYKWLLDKYAKEGDKILDTHLGSGSIAIACHDYKFDLVACEFDKEYYDKAIQRIKNHTNQQKLF